MIRFIFFLFNKTSRESETATPSLLRTQLNKTISDISFFDYLLI